MEIENWSNTGSELVRDLEFKNQTELAEFVLRVARYSDDVNHHADMKIAECHKLQLTITTHDKEGLSQLDYDWVKTFNERFNGVLILH